LPEAPTLLPQKVCDFLGTLWWGRKARNVIKIIPYSEHWKVPTFGRGASPALLANKNSRFKIQDSRFKIQSSKFNTEY
jgi:hypothetical protein